LQDVDGRFVPFEVKLDFFSGPLDLLLHLVRKQEVTIREVEMALVCEQYLQIVQSAVELDLELAAEFLVVAATLTALKSDALLPAESGEDLGEESADYYEELRERLRRYELYKERALSLRSRPQYGVDTFSREDKDHKPPVTLEVEDEDPQELGGLFVRLLRRIGESVRSLRVRLEPISVVEYMMRTIQFMQHRAPTAFFVLSRRSRAESREETSAMGVVIGEFIALLELVRRGVLSVDQRGSEIVVGMKLMPEEEELKEVNRV